MIEFLNTYDYKKFDVLVQILSFTFIFIIIEVYRFFHLLHLHFFSSHLVERSIFILLFSISSFLRSVIRTRSMYNRKIFVAQKWNLFFSTKCKFDRSKWYSHDQLTMTQFIKPFLIQISSGEKQEVRWKKHQRGTKQMIVVVVIVSNNGCAQNK